MVKGAWLLAACLVAVTPIAGIAATATVQIVDYGTFAFDSPFAKGPTIAAGQTPKNEQEATFQRSDRVPLQLGIRFGVFIIVTTPGTAAGQSLALRKITRFPAPGLKNPETGKTVLSEATAVTVRLGEQQGPFGYVLDHDWELVPGTWKIEFWYGDEKLAEQAFIATKP